MKEIPSQLPNPYDYRGVWVIKKSKKIKLRNEEYLEIIKELNKDNLKGGIIEPPLSEGKQLKLNTSNGIFLVKREIYESFDKTKEKIFQCTEKPSITFSFFSSIFDSRWKDMPYPSSILYLGSKTLKSKIPTKLSILDLEISSIPQNNNKIWGFTLFDDLIPKALNYLKELRKTYKGIIGIGGPFPTLSPIPAIAHFDFINFLYRGEAEEKISKLLRFIVNIDKNTLLSIFNKASEFEGFFYNDDNYFILSNIERTNRLANINSIEIDFSLIEKGMLKRGLELNLSRGCPRSCIFCSHVHGRNFRIISPQRLDLLLKKHKKTIEKEKIKEPSAFFININDDDILLADKKIKEIINTIKKNNYKIYGFQTSLSSFVEKNGEIKESLIKIIGDKSLYVSSPLLWLGTDAFSEKRRKRLGKQKLSSKNFKEIVKLFEENGVLNYHYWIILDRDSTWDEFFEEFFILWELVKEFKLFEILPTSSYLIPYPYTPSYLKVKKKNFKGLVLRGILKSEINNKYNYPLIKIERPEDETLTGAFNPEKNYKIIENIKNRNFLSAFQELYFLFKKSNYYNSLNEQSRREKILKLEDSVSMLLD